jgi:hypothetical protein
MSESESNTHFPIDREKEVGRRKGRASSMPKSRLLSEADQWLRTVHRLRGERGVCRKGLYKFRTFEEADQWMEMMILSNTQEYRR